MNIQLAMKDRGTMGISRIPHLKHPVLYRMRGCQLDILASFRSEEAAEFADAFLSAMAEEMNKAGVAEKVQ